MARFLLTAFLLLASSLAAAQAPPQAVDPNISIVSTQADSRVLVYDFCSPEHCWSESYLQVLSAYPDKPKVLCTAKIKEISTGHSVDNVSWVFLHNAPRAKIHVSASHGGFKSHTITLIPLDGCQYALQGASVGS